MAKNGAWHIADNPALYEPARKNNFRFVVTDIDNLVKAGVPENLVNDDTDRIVNGQEYLEVSVISTTVPHVKIGTIEVPRGNTKSKFAGVASFDDGSLVVNDFIGARTKSILMAWQALVFDVNSEAIHMSSNYKKTCYLYEYTPDYETVIRSWRLEGCWISDLSEDDFSNEEEGKKQVTATIVFDKAIPQDNDGYGANG